ncbi:MAG: ABC transporter ATP-binding protein [Eubacteriales bacterium]|nr:ABC transporter ATP-binding protein [Eubacteriales bacterium]
MEKKVGNFTLRIKDLELEEGCIHGFIGSNGSGKTTLAKLIMGIQKPDQGTIDYGGLKPEDITLAPQRPYLLHDTVYQNLIYPLKLRKQKPNREEMYRLLASCGLENKADQYARGLSSGERQKLSMLRAMCFHPKLIMVDETLSNLDPDSMKFFEERILDMWHKEKNTWILISHRMSLILRICQRVHVFQKGRLLESGETREVLFHSSVPEVRDFLAGEMVLKDPSSGRP